ncbi:MAG: Type site-specific deoxyribonuclease [Ignavibacteria bacterium]|nr:Type site-specific deoxyribonuclease [Ignavibacteria bacterium]
MPAPENILELKRKFQDGIHLYTSPDYNEENLKIEFLNPFFKALGWDVDNENGYATFNREVIFEESVRIGASVKTPDYTFRFGQTRKFFVEAKKPSINLKDNHLPAYQLRRYGWSAKLPLCILSNFGEFCVYNTRIKPEHDDPASKGRIIYFTYKDYIDKWDEIAAIFSKDAICKGSFDKYAFDDKLKKGTSEVDDEFLKEIEGWREMLARNISLRNPSISNMTLNDIVQKTIDRIVFLRICEDRAIEPDKQLMSLLNGTNIYPRLTQIFLRADDKYNSGLFYFKKEKDRGETNENDLNIDIDDNSLKEIIKRLYYPESPYEFSILPVEILGQVYERFLGKVIRLTANHQAKIEEKPEVRKAGGVYYTPQYIVNYIVENTIGRLIGVRGPEYGGRESGDWSLGSGINVIDSEETKFSTLSPKTPFPDPRPPTPDPRPPTPDLRDPKSIEQLKILDPACGSGSFLLGAYNYLLDWHLKFYCRKPEQYLKGKNQTLLQIKENEYRLSIREKKRILLNNIFGVDIDPQAVEVTKLSLMLKALEGESEESLKTQMLVFRERALPDLDSNIKCGNSLIGPDYYNNRNGSLFDDDYFYMINAFDWHGKSGFADVMKSGGFDVVIGNPPYVRIQNLEKDEIEYFNQNYKTAKGNYDIYCLFVEKGYKINKSSGLLSFILPHRFFKTDYGEGLREFLSKTKSIESIFDFDGYYVFGNASINTCVLLLNKDSQTSDIDYLRIKDHKLSQDEIVEIQKNESSLTEHFESGKVKKELLSKDYWNFVFNDELLLFEKLAKQKKLGDLELKILVGLQTSADPVYILKLLDESKKYFHVYSRQTKKEYKLEREIMFPLLRGTNVIKYEYPKYTDLLIFPYNIINKKAELIDSKTMQAKYPNIWEYFKVCRKQLKKRDRGNLSYPWYAFARNQNLTKFNHPKIMTTVLSGHNSFTIDIEGKFYFVGGGNAGVYGIQLKDKSEYLYILGLLNSKPLNWYHSKIALRCYQTAYSYGKRFIEKLPVPDPKKFNAEEKRKHEQIIALVESILSFNMKLNKTGISSHERAVLKRQLDTTDKQIDGLIYELFGLNDEEIIIIESISD